MRPFTYISPSAIPELNEISVQDGGLRVGACVSLTDLSSRLSELCEELPSYKTRAFRALLDQFKLFAGHAVRNAACLAGNIQTASPISDINPILWASNSAIKVKSFGKEEREVALRENMFIDYRTVNLLPTDVIISIFIPFTEKYQFVKAFKQSRRKEDDIGIFTD